MGEGPCPLAGTVGETSWSPGSCLAGAFDGLWGAGNFACFCCRRCHNVLLLKSRGGQEERGSTKQPHAPRQFACAPIGETRWRRHSLSAGLHGRFARKVVGGGRTGGKVRPGASGRRAARD